MKVNFEDSLYICDLPQNGWGDNPTFETNEYWAKTSSMGSTRKGSSDSIDIKPKFKT